jgi:hypothetical protein
MNADAARARSVRAARALGLVALATVASGCVFGGLRANPGYAAFGSPGVADTDRQFALSLGPLPLKIARVFVNDEELHAVLRDVKAVRVYTYEVDGDAERVKERMAAARDKLVGQGWEQIVAVRDDGELVSALIKMDGSAAMRGLAVIVQDHEDITLVNVIGRLKPETFSAVMAQLDVHLPNVALASTKAKPDAGADHEAQSAAQPVTAFADPAP